MIKINTIDFAKYLELYPDTSGLYPEKLQEIGDKYHEKGYLTKDELYDLAHLNSTRSSYHVKKNPAGRVEKVTEIAYEIEDDFSKIALLSSLKGVAAPTASAILTSLDEERHCVIDTRVWATLYHLDYFAEERERFEPAHYVQIIEIVRKMAQESKFNVAQIGYALFAYDVEHREGNLH